MLVFWLYFLFENYFGSVFIIVVINNWCVCAYAGEGGCAGIGKSDEEMLKGLEEKISVEVPRPVLLLLYYIAVAGKGAWHVKWVQYNLILNYLTVDAGTRKCVGDTLTEVCM